MVTLTMVGRIITARTSMEVSSVAPEGMPKVLAIKGERTIIPTRPKMTDGMPASSSTAETSSFPNFLGVR